MMRSLKTLNFGPNAGLAKACPLVYTGLLAGTLIGPHSRKTGRFRWLKESPKKQDKECNAVNSSDTLFYRCPFCW